MLPAWSPATHRDTDGQDIAVSLDSRDELIAG
jgi:hypothetical protein